VISPTGGVRDSRGDLQMRVTDGGLFENFGAVTADEVIHALVERRKNVQTGKELITPIAILISSRGRDANSPISLSGKAGLPERRGDRQHARKQLAGVSADGAQYGHGSGRPWPGTL
jgi:hypothetical protein